MKSSPPNYLDKNKYQLDYSVPIIKYTYNTAAYKDKKNKKYFAKIWYGNKKDKYYNELKNEADAYKTLWEIINNNKKILQNKFPMVRIPKFVNMFEGNGFLIILLEHISGRDLSHQDINIKLSYLNTVVEYLKCISNLVGNNDVRIKKKNAMHFILLLPILIVYAIVKHPRLLNELLIVISKIIKYSFSIVRSNNYGFVHKDINGENAIYSKGLITILDFQLLTWTLTSHDFGNCFYEIWNTSNSEALLFEFKKRISEKDGSEIKFMILYSVIFDLAMGNGKNESEAKLFIKYILRYL
jgi:hypothetical protein